MHNSTLYKILASVVFGLASIHKFRNLVGFSRTLEAFGLPHSKKKGFLIWIPLIELCAAVAGWLPRLRRGSLFVSLSLLSVYTIAIIRMIRRSPSEEQPKCDCFGVSWLDKSGYTAVFRNLVVASCLIITYQGRCRLLLSTVGSGIWNHKGSAIYGLIVASQFVLNYILLLRLGRVVVKSNDGLIDDDLPTRLSVPDDLRLMNTNGQSISLQDLLTTDQALVVFVHTDCRGCRGILEVYSSVQGTNDHVALSVVAGGEHDVAMDLAKELQIKQMFLQEKYEGMRSFGVKFLPSAILIESKTRKVIAQATSSEEVASLLVRAMSQHLK